MGGWLIETLLNITESGGNLHIVTLRHSHHRHLGEVHAVGDELGQMAIVIQAIQNAY